MFMQISDSNSFNTDNVATIDLVDTLKTVVFLFSNTQIKRTLTFTSPEKAKRGYEIIMYSISKELADVNSALKEVSCSKCNEDIFQFDLQANLCPTCYKNLNEVV